MALITVLLVLGYLWRRKHDAGTDANVQSVRLDKEDRAQYIVDVPHHEIIEVTRGPDDKEIVKKRFLAPHAKVEIRKDGAVIVTSRSWGSEFAPFVGAAVDTGGGFRGALGVNAFYVRRWSLGGGLTYAPVASPSVRAFASVSYTIWNNTSVFIGVDTKRTAFAGVSVKF